MKLNLVGPSSQQQSLPFNAERTVNLIPIADQRGKEQSMLLSAPGLSLFATAGDGPHRGGFTSTNGRAFFVSGSKLYEVDSSAVATERGTLNTVNGAVTIDENQTQLAVCDGEDLYIFTYATDVFAQVTDIDLPSVASVTFLGGYFICPENDTGKFYVSSLNDGTAWDALDFASAESSPDNLVRAIRVSGQLWLLGTGNVELWTTSGGSGFPFLRVQGGEFNTGIIAGNTAVELSNTVFWVGANEYGGGIVYYASGYTPKRISTDAIEKIIQSAPTPGTLRAFKYQQQGHDYYILTGGGMQTSLCYDVTTGLWHERAYLNIQGQYEQHLAGAVIYAFGKTLVGDRRNGKVYEMSLDFYDDNGDEIARDRILTHICDEERRVRFNKLTIGFEPGVGTQSGQGQDPECALRISRDGGRTWSDWHTDRLGAVGEYKKGVSFRRIGVSETTTFNIRVTDPVKVAIIGAYLS